MKSMKAAGQPAAFFVVTGACLSRLNASHHRFFELLTILLYLSVAQ